MPAKSQSHAAPALPGGNPVANRFARSNNPAHDLKNILEPVLAASLFTQDNVIVQSPPGMGKSEIMFYYARQVYGVGAVNMLECTPDVQSSRILGERNPLIYVDPDALAKGAPEFITRGTPRDPSCRIFIADEIQRLSDLAHDALVHLMHPLAGETGNRPPTWGTTNWFMVNTRTEAVRDRVSLTIPYDSPRIDVESIMRVDPISKWAFNAPSLSDVAEVQRMLLEPVPDASFTTVLNVLNEIYRLTKGGEGNTGFVFSINNRRIRQWQRLMFAMSYYTYGQLEFNALPDAAADIMQFAYPVISNEEAIAWRRIVSKVQDVVASAIAEYESNAYETWKRVLAEKGGHRGNREDLARVLGTMLADAQEEIAKRWPSDPRALAAHNRMSVWFMKACNGEEF